MPEMPGSAAPRLSWETWNRRYASPVLPTTPEEVRARGWTEVDVVFVTGDAYVDHPSFAMALLGRVLEAQGFRVAILSQPDWRSCDAWRQFGPPKLFFAISAGNMDSLINHYTANKKVRNKDAYSPGGQIGLRPDRATLAYCQRAREAFPGVPVIAGGVEASMRRLAHYDYWSDTVRRSILLDAKPDLVVYGMGEEVICELALRLQQGRTLRELRDLRGAAYVLGAKESVEAPTGLPIGLEGSPFQYDWVPSFEAVSSDKQAFVQATKQIHLNTNPFNAHGLIQRHDQRVVVVNPPALPLETRAMDRIYDLPFTRQPHPRYREPIPAFEMIKDSITVMRGCFGGCTFCSITAHQGRIIQSRSPESVLKEVEKLSQSPHFKGIVSDIGGPTANMYQMRCSKPEVEARCRRLSCVHPTICKLLNTDHTPLIQLMKSSRKVPGVRKVLVASGVRMDLAQRSPAYLEELTEHHVGGHLKVAPEHTDPETLRLMKKPDIDSFSRFATAFRTASERVGKPKQYLVPYFIASHPGSDLNAMIDLALFLKRSGYRPDQVQDFIPAPFDLATCMYYTGVDPMSGQEVPIAKRSSDRQLQRALLQFFKPENYFTVLRALKQAGRTDLIGHGAEALIPSTPPREALELRRLEAERAFRGESEDGEEGAGPVGGRRVGGTGGATSSRPGQRQGRDSAGGARGGTGYRPKPGR